MHVQPQNPLERAFAILTILFAMLIFSSFVSAVTNSTMRLWSLGASQLQDQLQFRKFLHQNSISPELAHRLNRYLGVVQIARQNVLHMKDVKLVSSLSGPLQQQLRVELFIRYLDGHILFDMINSRNSHLMCRICSECLNDKLLSQHNMIFSAGQLTTEMGFISHGLAGYTLSSKRDSVVGVFKGDWFCEPCLWTEWMHVGQLYAQLECEIISVTATAFRELAVLHPIALQLIRTYAVIYISLLNDRRERGELSDLLIDLTRDEAIKLAFRRESTAGRRPSFFRQRIAEEPAT